MPLFYFDVFDGIETIRDVVGLDLPDREAAVSEARRGAAEIAKDMILEKASGPVEIAIRDEANGPVVFSVSWAFDANPNA